MYKKLALLICAALSLSTTSAQTESSKQKELFHNYSKLLSPEKVYLHTDKDVYFATDTIWFSGYVENASYASEFDESNYIYVELINDELQRAENSFSKYAEYKKDVSVRKKIRRIGNSFQGHIVVPELNSTGRAVIRAYTYWMLNRPTEYMFYKELEITNPMKDKLVTAMADKEIKRKKDYLRIGEVAPDEKLKEEKAVLNERYDVQFLPESGNSLLGGKCIFYVKAIGEGGSGVQVFGEILDPDNNVLCQYRTDPYGFARVVLDAMPHGRLYATVKDTLGYEGKRVKLPAPVENGVTINGRLLVHGTSEYVQNDKVIASVKTSEELLGKSLSIFFHNGSEVYYSKPVNRAVETVSINLKSLTPGIHSALVADAAGNVYAERPFVVLPTQKETLEVETPQEKYSRREEVQVQLKVPAELLDSTASFSVAVTDLGLSGNVEKTTMQSYMLLKSELKGYIEDIEWYFNDSVSLAARMQKADMLMQTQGWRYYDIEKILQGKNDLPYFGREYRQTIGGKVMNPIGLTKKATVSFLAPSIGFRAMGQIDSGYFVLNDVDFPENTRFIVSAIGKNGKSQSHTPVLQNDWFAPVADYPVKAEKVTYSNVYRNVVEKIYYNKDDGEHAMAFELNPVVVTSQLVRLKNSPAPIPNYPLRREWIRDTLDMKSYAKNYTVAAYVTATYSGVREYQGNFGQRIAVPRDESLYYGSLVGPKWTPGTMSGKRFIEPGRWGLVLVYLNGVYIPSEGQEAIHNVLSLPLSEVESIVYIAGLSASPFQNAWSAGEVSPYPVLMVRTKPYYRSDIVPYNVSTTYPLGWQKPARFYSPKYDTPESKRSKAKDNRITLYWNPAVKLDENGEATISFYTSDSDSQYRIEVEGRSSSRQYHYAEKIIERKVNSEPASRKK